jgi:hypothetical protein
METNFTKGFRERKRAVFRKIGSRGIEENYDRIWSKMNSKERFWLMIFSKSSIEKGNRDWYLKFWIWDSEKNEIVGENVVEYFFSPEEPFIYESATVPMQNLSEAYLDVNNRRAVFRPTESCCYFIYTFEGVLLAQTEKSYNSANIKEEDHHFSKFIEKDIFFGKAGNNILNLYDLSQKNGILPKKIQILQGTGMTPVNNNIALCYSDKMEYLLILAQDESVGRTYEYFDTIWLYKKNVYEKCEQFSIVLKLSIDAHPDNIKLEKLDTSLCLSFEHSLTGRTVVMALPGALFNL